MRKDTYETGAGSARIPEAPKNDMPARNSDNNKNTAVKKEHKDLNKKSEKIKNHYFRTFYYTFAISFIILGSIAVIYFVFTQDKNIFGFSDRYYEKAMSYISSGDFENAEKSLEDCLKLDPDYKKARVELVELYEQEQKYTECEKLLKESIALQPRNEYYYKELVSVLTAQNKITEAIEFVNSISSSYMIIKMSESRPANVNSLPDPGTYDDAISVKLTGSENATVYYTTDGTVPTKNSSVYNPQSPISVAKGTVTIRAVAINDLGLISDEYSATYRIYNANTAYIFLDDKVEQMVRVALNKLTGTIYYRELENIKQLSNVKKGDYEYTGSIRTLEDLLVMPNLTDIALYDEQTIDDLKPLTQLKQLSSLTLSGCMIDDSDMKQISEIIWLSGLNIDNNQVSDISGLKNMSILKSLSAVNNSIKSISTISSLMNMKVLNLANNLISDTSPLSSLTALKTLDLSYNLITSASDLSSLTSLTELHLDGNTIKQLDQISRLTKLITLSVSDNPIQYLSPLSGFGSLSTLSIDGTSVTSLSELSGLYSLTTLDCSRTAITDFSPLSGMNVTNLTATQSALTSAETLALASSVEVLNISNNSITDATPLTYLNNLKVLNISNNPVVNLGTLASCKALSSVSCAFTGISQSEISELQNKGITVIQNK